jgi:Caspase domain
MARYALVISIAKYDHFRNLDKAATDAEAIAKLLEQHRYTVTRLPSKVVAENLSEQACHPASRRNLFCWSWISCPRHPHR